MLEVEIKAAVTGHTKEQFKKAAEKLGFIKGGTLQEIDVYFNGNDRNFMKTDEALRLRSVRDLDAGTCETFITYKGPKLDQASSTRMEFETAVGDLAVMKNLLAALGYKEVFTVDKTRQEWKHKSANVTLCLDSVAGLGDYLELETLAESEDQREAAVETLLQFLSDLGVPKENLTRKSYLELLIRP